MASRNFLLMLAPALLDHVAQKTGRLSVHPVSGGDINDCYRLEGADNTYFLKVNDAGRFPGMFEYEAAGLERLRAASDFNIPEVIELGVVTRFQFLLQSFVHRTPAKADYWEIFGRHLAQLHRNTYTSFGGMEDNYIGSLPQSNSDHGRWCDFYWHERIFPQMKLALDSGRMTAADMKAAEHLGARLDEFFPDESPALLHGDLWSGNQMCDALGQATIYDPAVYYGHREMDLAMMALFGGFDERMIAAYEEAFPTSPGRTARIEIAQLYPLLVHVNLFGGGYVGQVHTLFSRLQ